MSDKTIRKQRIQFQTKRVFPSLLMLFGGLFFLYSYLLFKHILQQPSIDLIGLGIQFVGGLLILLMIKLFSRVYQQVTLTEEALIVERYGFPYRQVYPLASIKGYQLFQVSSHQSHNFIIRFVTRNGKVISLYREGYQQYDTYFDRLSRSSLLYLGRQEYQPANSRWITVAKVSAVLTPLLLGLLWLVKGFQS